MNVQGKHISVIGAARSGVAVARLLQSRGAVVFVSDGAPAEKLTGAIVELQLVGIPIETGGHSERVYASSMMVISPGVPSDAPIVREALRRGIEVVSELEAASWFCAAPIAAITGSNGKTTTTTLVGKIMEDAQRKHAVGGNIGTAFSQFAADMTEKQVAILEVSSFQLDHCTSFHPAISAILNITADHMDRYDHSMELYAASKGRIAHNQTESDALVYCADDEWTVKTIAKTRARKIAFSVMSKPGEGAFVEDGKMIVQLNGVRSEIIQTDLIGIKGTHNLYNAMAAALIGMLLDVPPASIRRSLEEFKGVEHRLEFVRELDGVKYYNDSKATNVDSVWYALQAFKEPIVLMLGGRDKGNEYERLQALVKKHVRAIIALGESASKVESSFKEFAPITTATSIDEAVLMARKTAQRGDVVLLSPACASFDWFKNYEHRGKVFKELVKNLE